MCPKKPQGQLFNRITKTMEMLNCQKLMLARESNGFPHHHALLQKLFSHLDIVVTPYSEIALAGLDENTLMQVVNNLTRELRKRRNVNMPIIFRYFQYAFNQTVTLRSLRNKTPAKKLTETI